jgi:hypothetical protein
VEKALAAAVAVVLLATPGAAVAGELFGGLYKHAVDTPLSLSDDVEGGVDLQLGWRGGRIAGTPLQPYAFGALNSDGGTSYASVGLSVKFGGRLFVRPGIGLAVHNGSAERFDDPTNDKIDFGSRVLFEPEIAVGVQVAPRITAEAAWVHMSHAQLFSRENPGIDNIGLRVSIALP